jgi:hypothetical protein
MWVPHKVKVVITYKVVFKVIFAVLHSEFMVLTSLLCVVP